MADHVRERFVIEGRWTKAWKLVKWLQSQHLDADDAAGFDADTWVRVAGLAGVNPPSEKTQGIVIGLLRPVPPDPRGQERQQMGWE